MIVLDTHIWVWWVHGEAQLTQTQAKAIQFNETDIVGVSAVFKKTRSLGMLAKQITAQVSF